MGALEGCRQKEGQDLIWVLTCALWLLQKEHCGGQGQGPDTNQSHEGLWGGELGDWGLGREGNFTPVPLWLRLNFEPWKCIPC